MELNYGDARPVYLQIKERTKECIVSGAMAEHEKLPSVRELAAELAINPNTIQKAYKELEMEGYIYSQKGKGYFIAPMKESVQNVKKEEAFERFENVVRELKYLSADYDELKAIIDEIYKEGK